MSSFDHDSLGTPEPGAAPADELSAKPTTAEPQSLALGPDDDGALPPAPAYPSPTRPRITKGRVFTGILALILVAAVVSSFVSLPYYALTPGSATDVSGLITVPKSLEQNHDGTISLVDVEETPIRAIDYLYFWLDNHATIISSAAIQGPETNAQYYIEGVEDMADAQQAAEVVALNQLGYKVSVISNGVLVYAVDPGSPAESYLPVGSIVTAVDSSPTMTLQQLTDSLGSLAAGAAVQVTYRPYQAGGLKHVSFNLGVWRYTGEKTTTTAECVPTTEKTSAPLLGESKGQLFVPSKGQAVTPASCLGVLQAEQSYAIGKLPFVINLNNEGIVGPSAGLAFTLGLMQKLDKADLTGGVKVACTGTMDISGDVGEIGGIEQKTYAVRSAGDQVFIVPSGNYAEAKKYAGPDLKIYAVNNIAEALAVLKKYGGKIVKP